MAKTEDMNKASSEKLWYMNHDNIVTLIQWMADSEEMSYSKQDIAYAVEKPWKYEEEFRTAERKASEDRERETSKA